MNFLILFCENSYYIAVMYDFLLTAAADSTAADDIKGRREIAADDDADD